MNTGQATYFCPGRVNLIGEHIDYNGGLVMPAAISLGITASIGRNGTDVMRVQTRPSDEWIEVPLNALQARPGHWSDYIIGVMLRLKQADMPWVGCDIVFSSTLPQGSGLSSSAAIEVLTYYMLTHFLTGKEPDRSMMAIACQQVENAHIGVNCGIMDQFAVAMGKKDHALLLDCSTIEHQEIPIILGEHTLLIIDSKAPRQLAASAYNQRRKECDAALAELRELRGIAHLTQATLNEVETLSDPILRKRAKHVVTEQLRVVEAASALSTGNLVRFGELLSASHASLRDDYEVSSPPLDHIVSVAQQQEGCVGARLTGAGFGGCCIALVETSAIPRLTQRLELSYHGRFQLSIAFHACTVSDGVRRLTH